MDDPWDWTLDRVIQEFCSPNRSWKPLTDPPRLPNVVQLEKALRDNDVEGWVLLQFDTKELCPMLSIKIASQVVTFTHAIEQLRKRSRRYKSELLGDDQDEPIAGPSAPAEPRPAVQRRQPDEAYVADAKHRLRAMLDNSASTGEHDHVQQSTRLVHSFLPDANKSAPASQTEAPQSLPQKRRIAPELVSSQVNMQNRNRSIPTAADDVTIFKNATTPSTRSLAADGAYLGPEGLSRVGFLFFEDSKDDAERDWISVQNATVPVGRQRQVQMIMKRRLTPRKGMTGRRKTVADMVEGADNPEHDEVLPEYGESDSEEELDSETWEEVQKELAEKEAAPPQPLKLSADDLQKILTELVHSLIESWEKKKLPELERTAFKLWQDNRSPLQKTHKIQGLERNLRQLNDRLERYKQKLLEQSWETKEEVEKMSGALEATVSDKETTRWKLQILQSQNAPERVATRALTKREKLPRTAVQLGEDEEEILSSDEEGLRLFINDDDINMADDHVDADDIDVPMDIEENDFEPQHLGGEDGASRSPVRQSHVHSIRKSSTADIAREDILFDAHDQGVVPGAIGVAAAQVRSRTESPEVGTDTAANGQAPGTGSDMMPVNMAPKDSSSCAKKTLQTPSHSRTYEVIDLANSPANGSARTTPTSARFQPYANGTPSKVTAGAPKMLKIKKETSPRSSSRSRNRDESSPVTADRRSFLEMSIDDLDRNERQVARDISKLDDESIDFIFTIAKALGSNLWEDFVKPRYLENEYPTSHDDEIITAKVAYRLVRMLEKWHDQSSGSWTQMKTAGKAAREEYLRKADTRNSHSCPEFAQFLVNLSDRFQWTLSELYKSMQDLESASMEAEIDAEYGAGDDESRSANTPRRKKQPTALDKAARDLRQSDIALRNEQDARRKALRAKMQAHGGTSGSQFIINESKDDNEGLIYVNPEIARRIKDHQVQGVQFMWNLIAQKGGTRQGCLLAHSMGLGKTMQIITLLVALADASRSDDETIRSQVPEDLREVRFLILCPPTLVNNWYDELLCWTPEDHGLGMFRKVDSKLTERERRQVVQSWSEDGGILLLSYSIFRILVEDEGLKPILLDAPNLIVADEAHMMKNPKSKLHIAASNFRSQNRIAMTGSPLANNVEEYHSMINWVAPNYLSDIKSFRDHFARPIHEGLQIDSSAYQRRKMLARLRALKDTVAPKVDRKTIAVLKKSIPTKTEFVLVMPLTGIQRGAYELLIGHQQKVVDDSNNAAIFATLSVLSLLCAHPKCFQQRLSKNTSKTIPNQARREETADSPDGEEVSEDASYASLPPQLVADELTLLKGVGRLEATETVAWKIKVFLAIVEECRKLGDSILVFSQSISTLNYLERTLKMARISCDRLDGKTKMGERQDLVKDFNKGAWGVFLISTTAGGLGLNITGANRVIIFDFKFNPQHEQQAIGRAYRIGQTKEVFVYRFVCGGTFEEKMLDRVIFKMQLAQRVVDKRNPISKARQFAEFLEFPSDPPSKDMEKYRGQDAVLDAILGSETTRPGIRSVMTMDTFEEEELEAAEISPEDLAEAHQLVRQHVGPGVVPSSTSFPAAYQPVAPAANYSTQLNVLNATNTHHRPDPITDYAQTQGSPFPAPASAPVPTPASSLPPLHVNPETNGHRHLQSTPSAPLAPIAGASTNIPKPDSAEYIPAQHRVFKGELRWAFKGIGLPSFENEQRRRIAEKIADLCTQKETQNTSRASAGGMKQLREAIYNAAKEPRFIQGMVRGIKSPHDLVNMEPHGIDKLRTQWTQLSEQQWEHLLTTPQKLQSDPQHLQTALQRMSSLPSGSPSSQKPHHLADRAAMEAVMARRADRTPDHSTPTRFKTLPGWANAMIEQGGSSSRQSSLAPPPPQSQPQPRSTASSSPAPYQSPTQRGRAKPRNPFLND